ncbi:MAG: hypothetical protein VZR09_04955 [Candidatus Gastranaerophilaceae bacterium]|nr:hypothetical protein [Candidatus Gastranaerophilaceae bacterium]
MYLSDNKDEFLNFPKELYANDPFYTTKSENTSDCEKLFIVKEDEKILARAAIIYNAGLSYKNYKTLQVGFFEAENNYNAVKFLFDEIKKYAKNNGYDYLIGPINGSTWKKYRITLPSNNLPFLMDDYNKPYYAKLFEDYGFETISNYTSSITNNLNNDYSRLEKFEKIFENKGIKIRKFNPEKFEEDIRKIYDVSVQSFVNNFLYTPIEFEIFYKMYEPVKNFLNPEWILIAEDENNSPLAFIFGFDNLFSREKKSLVVKTLAQVPDYKYKGIGSYLTELLHKKAYLAGYDNIIHALMHESNVSANILAGELYHEYKLYGAKL